MFKCPKNTKDGSPFHQLVALVPRAPPNMSMSWPMYMFFFSKTYGFLFTNLYVYLFGLLEFV
jgi:hypothetical protein